MHALVDGHNAIGRLGIQGSVADRRRALLLRVARVTREATVFFDAQGASLSAPSVDREGGLEVRYCRAREADEEILAFVRGAPNPGALLVVTEDRELAGRVRQCGARSAGMDAFFARTGEPAPDVPGGAGGGPTTGRHERPLTAADFGLPPVIDLRGGPEWLEPRPRPPAPAVPGAPAPADPVAKARALAATLEASRPMRHVLLCAEPTKPKCAAVEVGRATWEHLKQRVKDLGLDALKPPPGALPGACLLRTKVDCLRVCADGPIAVVYPDGTWYRGVTAPVMERILVEHVLGGRPVSEHVLAQVPLGGAPGTTPPARTGRAGGGGGESATRA